MAMEIYGTELINPTIHEFLSQTAAFAALSSHHSPLSWIPNASGKETFAPLDPIELTLLEERTHAVGHKDLIYIPV